MRVTQGMISDNNLRHISNSYSKLNTYMDQLSTGKKVNKPSDDPVTVMKGMNYRSEVSRINQYKRNTGEVHNWMDNTDSALDKATQTLQKLRELAVQASNDSYSDKERKNVQKEAEQLKEHFVDIINTKVNGDYIFNGTNTSNPPIDEDGNFQGDTINKGSVVIEVAAGTKIQANVNPENVFGALKDAGGTDEDNKVFGVLADIQALIDDLGEKDADISANISSLDDRIDDVINARADLGARMNRLDLIEDRLEDQEIVATKIMSDNEDVDFEKVITDLITQESVHRAALSAGSRMIQPSLIDFLR
ncbi:flagellar hook-associated protein FlgL [Virgibacillus sp. MSJ-26]|uniref:flagellar hook-associated protein FlgL n=1 Tax=Virgibacillus sp. MSJ-26 TaxID=2841522 RepID=UPI001C1250F8|nr:flagellar hook-associated protein FlgL [Virgibacillus sp. MSJ-26]MBU5467796.1 flagellar hook-associated protein FlgL [Virgibacillus sp. MSJ-26]